MYTESSKQRVIREDTSTEALPLCDWMNRPKTQGRVHRSVQCLCIHLLDVVQTISTNLDA
jgi:hypothetical protein